jgi:hypothetical protein
MSRYSLIQSYKFRQKIYLDVRDIFDNTVEDISVLGQEIGAE